MKVGGVGHEEIGKWNFIPKFASSYNCNSRETKQLQTTSERSCEFSRKWRITHLHIRFSALPSTKITGFLLTNDDYRSIRKKIVAILDTLIETMFPSPQLLCHWNQRWIQNLRLRYWKAPLRTRYLIKLCFNSKLSSKFSSFLLLFGLESYGVFWSSGLLFNKFLR